MGKTQQFQYETMIEFMEKHGDLQWLPHDRLDNLKKWHELVDLLNNHASKGEAKPLEKWRKAWSDFKNNTRRKAKKIMQGAEMTIVLTTLERRVLRLMEDNKKYRTSLNNSDIQVKVQTDSDSFKRSPSLKRCFASVEEHDYASQDRRKSCSSSSSSSASSADPIERGCPRTKRKTEITPDTVRDITDRFFKYEREKEKMAHEQEMARIKQNEKLLSIVGRMVNVLETLAPSIQKYLNHNTNENG